MAAEECLEMGQGAWDASVLGMDGIEEVRAHVVVSSHAQLLHLWLHLLLLLLLL